MLISYLSFFSAHLSIVCNPTTIKPEMDICCRKLAPGTETTSANDFYGVGRIRIHSERTEGMTEKSEVILSGKVTYSTNHQLKKL
jgi:hypothetical protein